MKKPTAPSQQPPSSVYPRKHRDIPKPAEKQPLLGPPPRRPRPEHLTPAAADSNGSFRCRRTSTAVRVPLELVTLSQSKSPPSEKAHVLYLRSHPLHFSSNNNRPGFISDGCFAICWQMTAYGRHNFLPLGTN